MNREILKLIYLDFKSKFSADGTSNKGSVNFFTAEQDILKYIMELGNDLCRQILNEIGVGYEGSKIEREGETFEYKGNRKKSLHGLFGTLEYKRAYYVNVEGGSGYYPLDEKLGIGQRRTPAMQYHLSGFTGREAYEESLSHFHSIFRPAGKDLISFRKALDMDYDLGSALEKLGQQEIEEVNAGGKPLVIDAVERMAVSIDAAKVREREDISLKNGKKRREIVYRDAKIASISGIGWDEENQEAFCHGGSYVSGIEHADEFFKRIFVEMERGATILKRSSWR